MGERAVRFSYASSEKNIVEAARRPGDYLARRRIMRRILAMIIGVGLLSTMALVGCSSARIVKVVDSAGAPIGGAEVEAGSLSMNCGPNISVA